MVQIDSGYDFASKIALNKMFYAQKKWDNAIDSAAPALAAVFFKLLANRLQKETASWDRVRFRWLPKPDDTRELPESMNEIVSQIMGIPPILKKWSGDFNRKYKWNTNYNNIARLKDVFVALSKKIGTSNVYVSVVNNFDSDDYADLVDPWIFDYVRTRWDIFGFTIRDVLDVLDSIEYSDLSKNSTKQFVEVFNRLFPDAEIKMSK